MTNNSTNNARIAKNTLFLSFRTLLSLVVSLYTSRVVLAALGVVDYGIYDVVGGVVMMFSFLSASMSTSTQRYLTFELGRGDKSRLDTVFSTALNVHLLIGIAVVVLAETLGLWFLNTHMNIPPERMTAANYVFQFSVLSFFVSVSQVPYNAVLVAHEDMSIYAYFGILDVLLKLGIALLLPGAPFDKLVFYGLAMMCAQVAMLTIYRTYCYKKYDECRFRLVKDKALYKEMGGFAGWNVFGSLAWLLRDQGLNILLNIFIGPAINAARGISVKVSQTINSFVGNFLVALNPQITKNYAEGNISEMELLAYRGLKFSCYILLCLGLPIIISIDYILGLWLVEVPAYSAIFVTLMLADSFVNNLTGPTIITSLMATGNIRRYQIVVSSVILMIVPASWALLKLGCGPASVFVITIAFTALSGIVRFIFAVRQVGYSWGRYFRSVLAPVLAVLAASLPAPLLVKRLLPAEENLMSFIIVSFVAILCVLISSFYLGMTKKERTEVVKLVLKKLKR